jgi:hypothetical protein
MDIFCNTTQSKLLEIYILTFDRDFDCDVGFVTMHDVYGAVVFASAVLTEDFGFESTLN